MKKSAVEVFLRRLDELIPEGKAREVALRSGLNEQTLSKWKTRKLLPNPTLSTLAGLATALRVPLAYLISEGEGEAAQQLRFERERAELAAAIREQAGEQAAKLESLGKP